MAYLYAGWTSGSSAGGKYTAFLPLTRHGAAISYLKRVSQLLSPGYVPDSPIETDEIGTVRHLDCPFS